MIGPTRVWTLSIGVLSQRLRSATPTEHPPNNQGRESDNDYSCDQKQTWISLDTEDEVCVSFWCEFDFLLHSVDQW
jgi:hypothetical protein